MDMLEFLKSVASGTTCFKAASASVDDIAAFQPLVNLAMGSKALGYVETVRPHAESYTGHRFFDSVIVRDITAVGRAFIGDL